MRYLRTNTACRITVGPFFDKTDGISPETELTVTNEKLTLMVDVANVPTLILDTAPTASGGANDMVHVTGDDAGFYDLELAAANVNYLGRAILALTDAANHSPVFHEFMILPAVVYDTMVLGTDNFDVSMTQIAGQTVTCAAGVTVLASVGTASTNSAQTGDAYGRLTSVIEPDLVTITAAQSAQATLANQNIIIPDLVTITTNLGTANSNISAIQTVLSGITSLAKWLRGLFRKDTMDSTAKTEVNTGGGTFDETTDSEEALQEELDRIYAQTSVIAPSIITITNNQALQALDSTVSKPGTAQTITPPASMATLANQNIILPSLVTITAVTTKLDTMLESA